MEFAPLAHASIFDETSIFVVTVFPRVAASVAISAFVGEVPDYDSGRACSSPIWYTPEGR